LRGSQYDDTPAISTKKQNIERIMDDVMTHEVTMETNLRDVLEMKSKKNTPTKELKKEKKSIMEGQNLLHELQSKYAQVCQTSMEALESLQTINQLSNSINRVYQINDDQ
jgi:seryl-tRNA synthetase